MLRLPHPSGCIPRATTSAYTSDRCLRAGLAVGLPDGRPFPSLLEFFGSINSFLAQVNLI